MEFERLCVIIMVAFYWYGKKGSWRKKCAFEML